MFNTIRDDYRNLYELRKDFKRKFYEKMAKMGIYSYSRVMINNEYIDLNTRRELTDIQIETLEKEFDIRMTRCEHRIVDNIDEPLDHFGKGKYQVYIYRFR